ncbi:MAG: ribosome maturation factor RimP [Bacillota bacterium]|nr:MAG: ribosome maturation factor RimP [Bacillota bacterium]
MLEYENGFCRSHILFIREFAMKFLAAEKVKECLRPIAEEQGLTVVSVETKCGGDPSLTVYIDKAGGVDLDSCERFHNAVDAVLDALDPSFGEPYTLNVSSLGADRPFLTEEEFAAHVGAEVEVHLAAPLKGKKFLEGVLTFYDGKTLRLKTSPKETLTFDMANVKKVNEAIKFD